MSVSSTHPSRKARPIKKMRKWESKLDASESDQGDNSNSGTTSESATSNILLNNAGDEAKSKFVEKITEMIEKIAKESEERNVTEKRSQFQQDIVKKRSDLLRFGPFYGVGSDIKKQAKDAAWKHILEKSASDTERDYQLSITAIEEEAMEVYDIPNKDKPKPEDFRWMMIKDGCFFLQMALHILGGGNHLNYPADHPYFGKDNDTAVWIPHMFFMGNQIPYQVIHVLMKRTFFRDVINNGIQSRTWYCPDEENIAKMALYLTVVKPAFWSQFQGKPPPQFSEPPSDILDCLHNLFVGNKAQELKDSTIQEFEGLEAGHNNNNKIQSATELSKSGIKLATNTRLRLSMSGIKVETNRRPGIKNICFRNHGYCAKIYLPTLTIQNHTKEILTYLVKHEQNMKVSDREVTAYLRFMRDLVRTDDDFKILKEKRIIEVKDENSNGTIIDMFQDLAALGNSNFTLTFRHIRQSITEYGGPPWRLISIILSILAIVQTIFTILAYVRPLK